MCGRYLKVFLASCRLEEENQITLSHHGKFATKENTVLVRIGP